MDDDPNNNKDDGNGNNGKRRLGDFSLEELEQEMKRRKAGAASTTATPGPSGLNNNNNNNSATPELATPTSGQKKKPPPSTSASPRPTHSTSQVVGPGSYGSGSGALALATTTTSNRRAAPASRAMNPDHWMVPANGAPSHGAWGGHYSVPWATNGLPYGWGGTNGAPYHAAAASNQQQGYYYHDHGTMVPQQQQAPAFHSPFASGGAPGSRGYHQSPTRHRPASASFSYGNPSDGMAARGPPAGQYYPNTGGHPNASFLPAPNAATSNPVVSTTSGVYPGGNSSVKQASNAAASSQSKNKTDPAGTAKKASTTSAASLPMDRAPAASTTSQSTKTVPTSTTAKRPAAPRPAAEATLATGNPPVAAATAAASSATALPMKRAPSTQSTRTVAPSGNLKRSDAPTTLAPPKGAAANMMVPSASAVAAAPLIPTSSANTTSAIPTTTTAERPAAPSGLAPPKMAAVGTGNPPVVAATTGHPAAASNAAALPMKRVSSTQSTKTAAPVPTAGNRKRSDASTALAPPKANVAVPSASAVATAPQSSTMTSAKPAGFAKSELHIAGSQVVPAKRSLVQQQATAPSRPSSAPTTMGLVSHQATAPSRSSSVPSNTPVTTAASTVSNSRALAAKKWGTALAAPTAKPTPTSLLPQKRAPTTASNNATEAKKKLKTAAPLVDVSNGRKKKANRRELANQKDKKSSSKPKHENEGVPPPTEFPEPGYLCPNQRWYCCKNNDSLQGIADKLGLDDWKRIAQMPENAQRYGRIAGNAFLRPYTLLLVPTGQCSKWKLKQLHQHTAKQQEFLENDDCLDCGLGVHPDELLLCDGCDGAHCLKCVGTDSVPDQDWFCQECLRVLEARKNHVEPSSLVPALPPLSFRAIDAYILYGSQLQQFLKQRRDLEVSNLTQFHEEARKAWENRKNQLTLQANQQRTMVDAAAAQHAAAQRAALKTHGLRGWSLRGTSSDYIQLVANNIKLWKKEEVVTTYESYPGQTTTSQRWTNARNLVDQICRGTNALRQKKQSLEARLKSTRDLLKSEEGEHQQLASSKVADEQHILVRYAALLGEPQLRGETKAAFNRRETTPRFMGIINLQAEEDVLAINMLREPDELIIVLPVADASTAGARQDTSSIEPQMSQSYAVFARVALFDKKRDDNLPWIGVREAQGRLFNMLVQNSNNLNAGVVVRPMSLPDSVRLRTARNSSCFDLSELVRDCDVPVDAIAPEPTPKVLEENGLILHGFQQCSLRWLLDKEREEVGMGLAGELWHRMRFIDPRDDTGYYFCDLTKSFCIDISAYKEDVAQNSASLDRFSLPTGGFLADEMGLGKTVVAISLIVANPPPLHRRVLPREQKKKTSDHPSWIPPPVIAKTGHLRTGKLSNGTLVIVPLTLLSQWKAEVERFAPHLSVLALHSADNPTIAQVAASDIVLVTVEQTKAAKSLLNIVKRIHWHRILVDEAHLGQGEATSTLLATLSATHRHGISGTPIGAQLSDLYNQLRFLRVAPFHRPAFWKNQIEAAFYNRDPEALQVLRLLLSRIVVRHSKRQTLEGGKLPPRTVTTIKLQFATTEEKAVYQALEKGNRKHFMDLKRLSNANVLSKRIELLGLLDFTRQACAHSANVTLDKIHRFNTDQRRRKENGKKDPVLRGSNKSRDGVLEDALDRARPRARDNMRLRINQFLFAPDGAAVLIECPVCLEVIGVKDVALPACAHPVCSSCTSNLLDAGTSRREPAMKCPQCRDKIGLSEITYLGDAELDEEEKPKKTQDEDSKPAASAVVSTVSTTTNGFQMKKSEVRVIDAQAEASSIRATQAAITEQELVVSLHEDRGTLYTLDPNFLRNFYTAERMVGTKLAHLLKEIQEMMIEKKDSKAVVFSQHNGFLDLAGEELTARGIRFCRIDSYMKQHERADALLAFNEDPNCRVFLLSMRSGAVGLTLTSADHCFICDIAMNSSIEEQAIDRIHRIGQTKPVIVKRLVVEGSVEDRLLSVRRSLAVDQPDAEAGTQLCGARVLDAEAADAAAPRRDGEDSALDDEDGKNQKRMELLEALFDCVSGAETAEQAVLRA